jgi:hypothetical protein
MITISTSGSGTTRHTAIEGRIDRRHIRSLPLCDRLLICLYIPVEMEDIGRPNESTDTLQTFVNLFAIGPEGIAGTLNPRSGSDRGKRGAERNR